MKTEFLREKFAFFQSSEILNTDFRAMITPKQNTVTLGVTLYSTAIQFFIPLPSANLPPKRKQNKKKLTSQNPTNHTKSPILFYTYF